MLCNTKTVKVSKKKHLCILNMYNLYTPCDVVQLFILYSITNSLLLHGPHKKFKKEAFVFCTNISNTYVLYTPCDVIQSPFVLKYSSRFYAPVLIACCRVNYIKKQHLQVLCTIQLIFIDLYTPCSSTPRQIPSKLTSCSYSTHQNQLMYEVSTKSACARSNILLVHQS